MKTILKTHGNHEVTKVIIGKSKVYNDNFPKKPLLKNLTVILNT